MKWHDRHVYQTKEHHIMSAAADLTRLYVGNLAYQVRDDDLLDYFSKSKSDEGSNCLVRSEVLVECTLNTSCSAGNIFYLLRILNWDSIGRALLEINESEIRADGSLEWPWTCLSRRDVAKIT